jgi:hypothetical protein
MGLWHGKQVRSALKSARSTAWHAGPFATASALLRCIPESDCGNAAGERDDGPDRGRCARAGAARDHPRHRRYPRRRHDAGRRRGGARLAGRRLQRHRVEGADGRWRRRHPQRRDFWLDGRWRAVVGRYAARAELPPAPRLSLRKRSILVQCRRVSNARAQQISRRNEPRGFREACAVQGRDRRPGSLAVRTDWGGQLPPSLRNMATCSARSRAASSRAMSARCGRTSGCRRTANCQSARSSACAGRRLARPTRKSA